MHDFLSSYTTQVFLIPVFVCSSNAWSDVVFTCLHMRMRAANYSNGRHTHQSHNYSYSKC